MKVKVTLSVCVRWSEGTDPLIINISNGRRCAVNFTLWQGLPRRISLLLLPSPPSGTPKIVGVFVGTGAHLDALGHKMG
jgi:hypothetical protein